MQRAVIDNKFSIKLAAKLDPRIEHFIKLMGVWEFYLHLAAIKKYNG